MKAIFCDDEYGISIDQGCDDPFPTFLERNRIYATSAIKCFVDGDISSSERYVIQSCRERFLDSQISAMPNLELIIPMGTVAACSLLRRSPSSISITSIIGQMDRGIRPEGTNDTTVVVFPHPSGINPYANPPIIDEDDGPTWGSYKHQFQGALRYTRDLLRDLGYDVMDEDPDSWEPPEGLFKFF